MAKITKAEGRKSVARDLAVEFGPRDGSDFAVHGDARERLERLDRRFGVRTKIAVDGPRIKSGSHVLENALQKPDVGTLGALLDQRRVQPAPGELADDAVDMQRPRERPRMG